MALVSLSPRSPKVSTSGDHTLLMYRLSKTRSNSCGAAFRPQTSQARRADFTDSDVVFVQSRTDDGRNVNNTRGFNDTTEGEKVLGMSNKMAGETWRKFSQHDGKNGFARLDMVS